MIERICAFIHNYFVYGRYSGVFTISNGELDLPFLVDGQYFRICGSRLNDGVYTYPATGLSDETFEGVIWEMRVPKSFIMLANEIAEWENKYGEVSQSPYQSESFGGYSYSKSSAYGGNGASTDGATWQSVFKAQLNQYRKLA